VSPRRKLRVLLLIKCLGRGGAERILADLARNGDTDEFEYEAAYVLEDADGLVAEMRAAGTPVHSLGARGDWDLRWLSELRRVLARGRFDIVHAHLPYAAGLGRLVSWTMPSANRPRYLTTEHNLWGKTTAAVRLLNAAGIWRDDALVAVSDAVRDSLPRAVRTRAEVVVHGIDLSVAPPLLERRDQIRREVRSELGLIGDSFISLTVANFRAEKGYEILLEAAEIVSDSGLGATFVSVGYGPLEEQLKELHARYGLGDSFRFLGAREDVVRLMVASDLFVLSSHYEGLPVALMEATSAGLPIVATAVGGIPKVITDGRDGLLVRAGDPRALAEAIRMLAADEALRNRLAAASLKLQDQFDVARGARQMEKIYSSISAIRSP
jgi:glycosyltransferase involved in cell wall biosynthesis